MKFSLCRTWTYMKASDQPRATAALALGKELPVPFEQKPECVPEAVYMLWKSEIFLATFGNRNTISQLRSRSAIHYRDRVFRITITEIQISSFVVLIGFWTLYMSYHVSKRVPILTILDAEQIPPPQKSIPTVTQYHFIQNWKNAVKNMT